MTCGRSVGGSSNGSSAKSSTASRFPPFKLRAGAPANPKAVDPVSGSVPAEVDHLNVSNSSVTSSAMLAQNLQCG